MKRAMLIATIAIIVTTATAFGGTTTLLKKKLDAAIAASDWRTAETISTIMANMAATKNHTSQEEFFRHQREVVRATTNLMKAAPAMLRVAQGMLAPRVGTEEHFMLHVAAPQLLKVLNIGTFDEPLVVQEWKKFQESQEARRLENKKRWEEQRRKWEVERKQREAARKQRMQR